MSGVHRHRLLVSLVIAAVCVAVAVAGAAALLDQGSDSTGLRTAPAVHTITQDVGPIEGALPIVCGNQYGSLLAVMGTSMTPEAVARIDAVLSDETTAGLRATAAAAATVNAAPATPDPVTLAWAIGRLTPAEQAAIIAELPQAMRDSVESVTPAAAAVIADCS